METLREKGCKHIYKENHKQNMSNQVHFNESKTKQKIRTGKYYYTVT